MDENYKINYKNLEPGLVIVTVDSTLLLIIIATIIIIIIHGKNVHNISSVAFQL